MLGVIIDWLTNEGFIWIHYLFNLFWILKLNHLTNITNQDSRWGINKSFQMLWTCEHSSLSHACMILYNCVFFKRWQPFSYPQQQPLSGFGGWLGGFHFSLWFCQNQITKRCSQNGAIIIKQFPLLRYCPQKKTATGWICLTAHAMPTKKPNYFWVMWKENTSLPHMLTYL
jgi:hypothetical protein